MPSTPVDRLDTLIKDFDIITAVAKHAINREFEMLYKVEPSLQKIDVKSLDYPISLQAKISKVQVMFIAGSTESINFSISMESGTFKFQHQGPKETPIKNWVLVFAVKLKSEESKEPPKHVIDGIKQSGLGVPGDYSIEQLLIDFSTADFLNYDDKLSVVPGLEKYSLASFSLMMDSWITDSKLAGGHILSYLPKRKTPPPIVPTLLPTKLRYQAYPFLPASAPNDYDMFLYTEMTEGADLPGDNLRDAGNWVVPGAGGKMIDGCVAFSRRVFFEQWLLEHLKDINRATYVIPHRCDTEKTSMPSWVYNRYGPTDYAFNYDGLQDGHLTWSFVPTLPPKHSDYQFAGQILAKIDIYATVKNYVKIPVAPSDGICRITVSGHTSANVQTNVFGDNVEGTSYIDWTFDLILKSVGDEGKLNVAMEPSTLPNPTVKYDHYETWIGKWDKSRQEEMRKAVDSELSKITLSDVTSQLTTLLGGTWAFYFGHANYFYLKNAAFNREGDLLAELQYKGV